MPRAKLALLCLALSTMIATAPGLDFAWAKDSGGGRSNGTSSGNGGAGIGGNVSSISRSSTAEYSEWRKATRSVNAESKRLVKKKRVLMGSTAVPAITVTATISALEADLAKAQKALREAQMTFNQALTDPRADLEKLERAIRNAEQVLSMTGGRVVAVSNRR